MSDQPEPPIKRFLNVPDLVGNVFERLDSASRRAFFQAHHDVAQNAHVLAHTKLRIELTPESLECQWQRVLRLTRSQPIRCLVIAGPSKEQLQDFLHCVPEGKHEEKQRVLQGTELQLQVYIKLETGGMRCLQSLLRHWCNEQEPDVEDARVQLVLDLCGRELNVTDEGDLEPPSCCTIRNGMLQLCGTSCVRVLSDRVCFESIVLMATDTQEAVVMVVSGGSLVMEGCCVEGGIREAIMLCGAGASLFAQGCSIWSSRGCGLVVRQGGRAALEHATVSSCRRNGIFVCNKDSRFSAAHCCFDGNGWHSMLVVEGAHVCLSHCSSDGSRAGNGWCLLSPGCSLVASDSSASNNKSCGAFVLNASASLSSCTANGNVFGWCADNGSISATACQAQDNSRSNLREVCNGRITCLDE